MNGRKLLSETGTIESKMKERQKIEYLTSIGIHSGM